MWSIKTVISELKTWLNLRNPDLAKTAKVETWKFGSFDLSYSVEFLAFLARSSIFPLPKKEPTVKEAIPSCIDRSFKVSRQWARELRPSREKPHKNWSQDASQNRDHVSTLHHCHEVIIFGLVRLVLITRNHVSYLTNGEDWLSTYSEISD